MKSIPLEKLHYLARHSKCEDWVQYVKVQLTGQPITTVIDCNPVVVDLNKLKEKEK